MQGIRRNAAAIAIAVALIGLFAVWLASTDLDARGDAVEAVRRPDPPTSRLDGAQDVLDDVAVASGSPAAVEPAAEDTSPAAESRRSVVATEPRASTRMLSGQLIVRAISATTGEPLTSFGVRLASETRFADERAQDVAGEIDLMLTPDTYALVVYAPGYESLELPRAQVRSGAATRLEPARLREGTARITVEIRNAAAVRRALHVELIGTGRGPCERCGDADDGSIDTDRSLAAARASKRASPCPACGFARERSIAPVVAARLEFGRLASGSYALRVCDDRNFTVSEPKSLELYEGASARVEFDLASQRHVELEWLDVDGSSLSKVWHLRDVDQRGVDEHDVSEIVSFENGMYVEPIRIEVLDDQGGRIANAGFVPPLPHSTIGMSVSVSRGLATPRQRTRDVADRPRAPDQSLTTKPVPPRFLASNVACELDEHGLTRLGPLPRSTLELHATTAHFAADALVPASSATTRVTMQLRPAHADSEARPEFATYAACELSKSK